MSPAATGHGGDAASAAALALASIGFGEYAVGILGLAAVLLPIAWAAIRLRSTLSPGWSGAPARLIEAVLAIGLLTTLSLLLGSLGLLVPVALILGAAAVAASAEVLARRRRVPPPAGSHQSAPHFWAPAYENRGADSPNRSLGAVVAALAVVTVGFALWGVAMTWSLDEGITNFDSVWYHLPFAAEMAQSGSTTGLHRTETVFLTWFYPQGSELIHAVGMVMTDRDVFSLIVNLGWLALAFLAAWCIGRPYGRGHLTVAAAAILLTCHNLTAREPGTAKNDIAAIALLLASASLLVNLLAQRVARADRATATGPGPGDPSASALRGAPGGDPPRGPDGAPGDDPPRGPDGAPGRDPARGPVGASWPLFVAALAAGLAAGVKVTVLAPVAVLTVGAIVFTPAGRRLAALGWWALGLVVGGAYWYLRNLIVAGNPLPQVRELGPLSLPGPDTLQTARPDFTVADYLTDGTVWADYFLPGLERGFGALWPLVAAAAVFGAVWALTAALTALRRPTGALPTAYGAAGLAALVGIAAYFVTPLSAAGAEGEPTAFAINLRFAIPSLILGLVLVPLASARWGAGATWALFAALAATAALTNGLDAALTDSGRAFGWALALALVAIPAALVLAWARLGPARRGPRAAALIGAAGLIALLLGAGFAVQRSYLDTRYADFQPDTGMAEPYRWASQTQDATIGLAGTTAGFKAYGFYGPDLSNSVTYLGTEAPAGGFHPIASCAEFRDAVNDADLDYLVTAPFLNFLDPELPVASPERRWVENDPAVVPLIAGEGPVQPVTVWRVAGRLDPTACGPGEAPLVEVPDTPR